MEPVTLRRFRNGDEFAVSDELTETLDELLKYCSMEQIRNFFAIVKAYISVMESDLREDR